MKRTVAYLVFCVLVGAILAAGPSAALAQGGTPASAPPPAAKPAAAAPPSAGFRADFLADWDDMAKKAVSLAEAIPAEKYTWRPEGARSVSEIFLHIANGNFGLMQALGIQPPAGVTPGTLEKSTSDKAKVVELLRQSFEHVRQALLNTPDADLDKPVKLFGHASTVHNLFYIMGTHQHEHFGLTIAYARVNGVVPPWTAERQAQPARQPEKPKQ